MAKAKRKQDLAVALHRKAHLKIISDGFFECKSFSCLPFEEGIEPVRIGDTAVHPDGTRLYVKIKTVKKTDWLESNLGNHLEGGE